MKRQWKMHQWKTLPVALGLLLCGGCSQGHSLKLDTDTRKFSIKGIKASPDDPFNAALLHAYEVCGGERDGDTVTVYFETSSVLPSWSDEEGWQYQDIECRQDRRDGATVFLPAEAG